MEVVCCERAEFYIRSESCVSKIRLLNNASTPVSSEVGVAESHYTGHLNSPVHEVQVG